MMINIKYTVFLSVSSCCFLFFGHNSKGMIAHATQKVFVTPNISANTILGQPQAGSQKYSNENLGHKNNGPDSISTFPLYNKVNLSANWPPTDVQKIIQTPYLLEKAIKWFNKKTTAFNKMLNTIENCKTVMLHSMNQSQDWEKKIHCTVLYIAYQYAHAHATKISLPITTQKQKKHFPDNYEKNDKPNQTSQNNVQPATALESKSEIESDPMQQQDTSEKELVDSNEKNAFEDENRELQEKIAHSNKKVKELENAYKVLQNAKEKLAHQIMELESANKKSSLENQKLRQHTKEIKQREIYLEQIKLEMEALKKEKALQDIQLNTQENIANALEEENRNLHNEKHILQQAQRKLHTIKTNLEQTVQEKMLILNDAEKEKINFLTKISCLESESNEYKTSINSLNNEITVLDHTYKEEQEKSNALQAQNDQLHKTIQHLKEDLSIIKNEQETIENLLHCITECMEEEKQERKDDIQNVHNTTEKMKKILNKKIKTIKKDTKEVQSSLKKIAKVFEEDALNAHKEALHSKQKYDWTKYLLCFAIVFATALALENIHLKQQLAQQTATS
jgi:hypothetical protein